MRIFISADCEGISGIIHSRHTVEGSDEYQRARKLMTQEVNAAVEGAIEAGADEVLINDSHGSMRNIIIEDLDPRANLLTGFPKPLLMMEGIDETFDGAVFVGYHSMAKSRGVLAHTISGFTFASIKIGGVEFGETALNAAVAGCFNVPVIAVAGDNVLEKEAFGFLPDIEFAQVKKAHGTLAADCLSPENARKLIKEKTKYAVSNIKKYKPFIVNGPVDIEVKLNSPVLTDVISIIPGVTRVSSDSVTYKADNMITAMKMIATMMNASCVMMISIYK